MGTEFDSVINTRRSIFTASGIFTGLVVDIRDLGEKGYGYSLEDVIYRPSGNIKIQMPIPEIALYSSQFIATTFDIEPIEFS